LIIIDASVAVKWVVDEPLHAQALTALELDATLIAPDFMLAEFASVMRRKLRGGEVAPEQIGPGLQLVRSAISEFVPSEWLVEDALLLSEQLDHSPYDCMYLACALSRGKLLTADAKFIDKCRAKGFGSVVIGLGDIADGRYEALATEAGIGDEVLAEIKRLTPLIRTTKDYFYNMASADQAGSFKAVPVRALLPAFDSVPYRKLAERIAPLDPKQLAYLIALGWLGKSHHNGADWSYLLQNAKGGHLSNDFHKHKAYIMAQMNAVPAGLAKLRAHYNLTD
jgi:predicted nucleic acid-binding protein